MLPRKNFENLHAVMAILVLFEQFLGKFCLNFLTLILSASPNIMHFVRTFSTMRASGVRRIAIEEQGRIQGGRWIRGRRLSWDRRQMHKTFVV